MSAAPDRRLVGKIVCASLILGVLANIGVTIIISVMRSHQDGPSRTVYSKVIDGARTFDLRRITYAGMTRLYWTDGGSPPEQAVRPDGVPAWSAVARDIESRALPEPNHLLIEVGFGWPFISASYEYTRLGTSWGDDRTRVLGGVDLGDRAVASGFEVRSIPYRLAWIGFASNSAIYAGLLAFALFVVCVAPRLIFIRRYRRANGLCAVCGYDRAGLGPVDACPECGHLDRAPAPA